MTPEERKAIAMRYDAPGSTLCQRHYPGCCSYHEGFAAALALLVPTIWPGHGKLYSIKDSP